MGTDPQGTQRLGSRGVRMAKTKIEIPTISWDANQRDLTTETYKVHDENKFIRSSPTFRGNILPFSTCSTCCLILRLLTLQLWRRRQYVPPKRPETYTRNSFLLGLLFEPEVGGSTFLRNVERLPNYTASHPRVQYFTQSRPWKPQTQ
jgi:hypothetical protein